MTAFQFTEKEFSEILILLNKLCKPPVHCMIMLLINGATKMRVNASDNFLRLKGYATYMYIRVRLIHKYIQYTYLQNYCSANLQLNIIDCQGPSNEHIIEVSAESDAQKIS